MITCLIFLAVNENGEWEIAKDDAGDAATFLTDNGIGTQCRVVQITVNIEPPKADEVTVDVPDEAGETVTAKTE
jgi:hypothetical protein